MQPILFSISGPIRNKQMNGQRGVPPNLSGVFLLPVTRMVLSGVTKDETGAAAGGYTVYLFDASQDPPVLQQQTISDGSGNYSFNVGHGSHWAVSYKKGTPDKAGATLNTLEGVTQ